MKLHIPSGVLCVAAVKYATPEQIEYLIRDRFTTLGWSTVQQFQKLHKTLPSNCHHHFIGHLQLNKVNQLIRSDINLIHSVDSADLIDKIDNAANSESKIQHILLQVKTDATKEHGFSYEEIDELFPWILAKRAAAVVEGFMTIPPLVQDPEENRSVYKRMREFRDAMEKKYKVSLPYLSMGMSDDYEIAIEEGATIVRLGRILFEQMKKS